MALKDTAKLLPRVRLRCLSRCTACCAAGLRNSRGVYEELGIVPVQMYRSGRYWWYCTEGHHICAVAFYQRVRRFRLTKKTVLCKELLTTQSRLANVAWMRITSLRFRSHLQSSHQPKDIRPVVFVRCSDSITKPSSGILLLAVVTRHRSTAIVMYLRPDIAVVLHIQSLRDKLCQHHGKINVTPLNRFAQRTQSMEKR